MSIKIDKVDCPNCLFSSGFMPFTGSFNQTCKYCLGKGYVSKSKRDKYLIEIK